VCRSVFMTSAVIMEVVRLAIELYKRIKATSLNCTTYTNESSAGCRIRCKDVNGRRSTVACRELWLKTKPKLSELILLRSLYRQAPQNAAWRSQPRSVRMVSRCEDIEVSNVDALRPFLNVRVHARKGRRTHRNRAH
jgi:hypothetical protein